MKKTVFVMATLAVVLLASGTAYATTVKPNVPTDYCSFAWWDITCWLSGF